MTRASANRVAFASLSVLSAWLGGCSDPGGSGDSTPSATQLFEQEVQPLFESQCLGGCHQPGGENTNLLLGPGYGQDTLVNVASKQSPLVLVKPGNPGESYLWRKLQNTHLDAGGKGEPMPYARWPMDDESLAIVETYILALP